MAEAVVHGLQPVDVEHHERQRPAVPGGPRNLPLGALLRRAPVEQPGEGVQRRLVAETAEQRAEHGGDGDDPDDEQRRVARAGVQLAEPERDAETGHRRQPVDDGRPQVEEDRGVQHRQEHREGGERRALEGVGPSDQHLQRDHDDRQLEVHEAPAEDPPVDQAEQPETASHHAEGERQPPGGLGAQGEGGEPHERRAHGELVEDEEPDVERQPAPHSKASGHPSPPFPVPALPARAPTDGSGGGPL